MVKKLLTLIGGILLSLFISTNLLFADVQWQKYAYWQNWGGLNDQLSATEIQDNEASDIQNIIFDNGGALKKRYGFEIVPNTPIYQCATGAITGLTFYQKNDGSRYVVAVANGTDDLAQVKSKTYDVGGGLPQTSWSNIGSDILPSSYSDDYLPDFAVAEDNLILTFPSTVGHKPFKWSGSGFVTYLTSDSDCPNASIVRYHKNQLFLSGNSDYPSRIWFSALDDITDYTATDFFDVQTSDGTKVRGLVSAFNSLYIFKDKSIWRLSGTNRDDFMLEKMVDGIGTLSQQSIAIVNNLIYFTTNQNDIAVYDGGYNVVFLSQKIRNTVSNLNATRATNNLGLAFSTYKHSDSDYYASVSKSGSGTNNEILFFDTALKAWSKFKGINANAWCVADNDYGQNQLLFGDYSGFVYSYPSTSYIDKTGNTNSTDNYTKLLLHCDGTNGSTTFTDVLNNVVTANGDAQINTTYKKFGTGSGLFDGTGDYLSLADSADWDFGTSAFTIDFWCKLNSDDVSGFCGQYVDGDNYWEFNYNSASHKIWLSLKISGTQFAFSADYTADTNFHHYALVRIDNGNAATSWRIFVDGVSYGLTLVAGNWSDTMPTLAAVLSVGTCLRDVGFFTGGYIDEFRVSKGVARWTTNFIPETSAYNFSLFSNNNIAIDAYYQTKWFKYPEVALGDKYWRLLKTYALSETADSILYAECRADYEASGRVLEIDLAQAASLWDVAQWDIDLWGGQSLVVGRNEIEKGKNMFQIKYSNDTLDQGFTIFGFENFIEGTSRI